MLFTDWFRQTLYSVTYSSPRLGNEQKRLLSIQYKAMKIYTRQSPWTGEIYQTTDYSDGLFPNSGISGNPPGCIVMPFVIGIPLVIGYLLLCFLHYKYPDWFIWPTLLWINDILCQAIVVLWDVLSAVGTWIADNILDPIFTWLGEFLEFICKYPNV